MLFKQENKKNKKKCLTFILYLQLQLHADSGGGWICESDAEGNLYVVILYGFSAPQSFVAFVAQAPKLSLVQQALARKTNSSQKCPQCQDELVSSAAFCGNCGFCVCIFFATYNLFEGYKIIAEVATLEVQNE